MGKSSNTQTGHGLSDTFAAKPVVPDTFARSNCTKPPSTSTLTASLTSRPPSPSPERFSPVRHPGITSADDEDDAFHDALDQIPVDSVALLAQASPSAKPQRTSGLQQSPLSAQHTTSEPTYYEGDTFYDVSERLAPAEPIAPQTKPQRASGVQQAPEPLEGASKGRIGSRPARGARNTSHASSSTVYYPPTPGRGSSRPAASSIAAPAPNPPGFGTQPPPSFPATPSFFPVATTPVKRALLIGVDYRNTDNPLRHATKDAVMFGKVLNETLKFPEENLVFVTDMEHNTPSCFTTPPKRNQGASLGLNLANGTSWQGSVEVKDKKRFVQSTRHNMIEGFRWLVRGAKAGDDLVMLFSGHCAYYNGKGPFLVATGGTGAVDDMVSKNDLLDELVLKVPAGCRLQIVFDCCNSSALVDLQYCVGSMRPDPQGKSSSEADRAEEPNSEEVHSEEPATAHHITSKATQAPAPVSAISCDAKDPPTSTRPDRQIPIHASLYGVSQALDPPDPLPPGSFDVPTFTPPAVNSGSVGHRAPKRPGGVVAAPPPTNPESGTSTGLTSWFSWAKEMVPGVAWLTWMKEMIVPGVTPVLAPAVPATSDDAKPVTGLNQSAEVRRVRNFVAEAPRPTDYFEERTSGYVKPVGQVIVWAASGAHQYAFEASGARSGIVTGALCKALEACNDLTRRDLWLSIKNAIELENTDRERRDLTKDVRPNRKHRVQHAELWTSQVEPLHSAAPILDKPAFSPINDPTPRDQVAPL